MAAPRGSCSQMAVPLLHENDAAWPPPNGSLGSRSSTPPCGPLFVITDDRPPRLSLAFRCLDLPRGGVCKSPSSQKAINYFLPHRRRLLEPFLTEGDSNMSCSCSDTYLPLLFCAGSGGNHGLVLPANEDLYKVWVGWWEIK